MYRAVAEAVNGLQVFAKGKWLTCIGNKSVRVGDKIWTDGRCVYGFNREGSAPMVIVSPPKEDWGIPIIMFNSDEKKFYYYTYKNSLKLVKTIKWDSSEKAFFDEDTQEKCYDFRVTTGNFITYNEKRQIYSGFDFSVGLDANIVTANCTNEGDIYTIQQVKYTIKTTVSSNIPVVILESKFDITKNGVVVKQIDLLNLLKEAESKASAHVPKISVLYDSGAAAEIKYAVIYDANNWDVLVEIAGSAADISAAYDSVAREMFFYVSADGSHTDDYVYCNGDYDLFLSASGGNIPETVVTEASVVRLYHINSQGMQISVFDYSVKLTGNGYLNGAMDMPRILSVPDSNFHSNEIISLPDGYYFKYGLDVKSPNIIQISPLYERIIYNPNGEIIFSGYFFVYSRIVIQRIGLNIYLMSVGVDTSSKFGVFTDLDEPVSIPDYISGGLYIIKDGLIEACLSKTPKGQCYCINHCLRKMQEYQKWQDNVQNLNTLFSGSDEE